MRKWLMRDIVVAMQHVFWGLAVVGACVFGFFVLAGWLGLMILGCRSLVGEAP